MAEKIYVRNASGDLEPLTEERFETEDLLQELIGQHPELLAGEQIRPDDPLRWILIKREMPIEGWAVDHLLIDQHARPTLVEVKRSSNREIRRTIVGQMVDYADTAASVWSGGDIRQIFEEHSNGSNDEVSNLLQADDEPDIDAFWEQVATNLAVSRLRLLFVADEIPAELERVVKFLNEHTRDNLEVLAVEIKQCLGESSSALVPRVIGQSKPHVRGENAPNKYLCGCDNNTKRRFYPGHDSYFGRWLSNAEKGSVRNDDGDLSYAVERCLVNPDLHYSQYNSDDIIRLATKQAHLRQ